jgi:hypothetical protein
MQKRSHFFITFAQLKEINNLKNQIMKNLLKLAVVAIMIVAFNACGSKSDTPEAVAEKFLNHLNKKEYADAKKLGTEQTGQMIDMMESFGAAGGNAEKKDVKIENMKCTTTDDKSACTYTAEGKEEKIELVKKDGKWLVDMKKEGTGETPPAEAPADTTAAAE